MSPLTAAESDLLREVFNDAFSYHLAPSMGCPACDAADTGPESPGACEAHQPAQALLDRYDALAGHLVALGLLPVLPE